MKHLNRKISKGFKLEKNYLDAFKRNKLERGFSSDSNYFRYIITKDTSDIENDATQLDTISIQLKKILTITSENTPIENNHNSASNIRLLTKFDLILKLLFKILSLQIEPYPDGSSESILDEQRIGEDKAKEIIFEDLNDLDLLK